MTIQEFDDYRFSIFTQVKYKGDWYYVSGFSWGLRSVSLRDIKDKVVRWHEIEEIKEGNVPN